MNVLEVERSCCHVLENSIVTSFLFVYCIHIVVFEHRIAYVFLIAMRAKVWESSKDIVSPAYQCARFAARLTLGLLNAYVLNPT